MHRNNLLIGLPILAGFLSACIREYDPEIAAEDEMKYVISGYVTDETELQTINVSMTSPLHQARYIPVVHCKVKIMDDKGNVFVMQDKGNGNYSNTINATFLQEGVAFKVEILTTDGDMIISNYDTLTHGDDVDSLYYKIKAKQYPALVALGLQFYLDFEAASTASRYYRWDVIETYEYRTEYPLEWYYDGIIHHVSPPDHSKMVCWRTIRLPDIYTLTTAHLSENKYPAYEFHYVNNLTVRLYYGYSLLVRQFALSHEAFAYYESLRVNSDPEAGLYDHQPIAVQGNLYNTTHPEKQVLGFFAASASRKRIFVYPIPELKAINNVPCEPGVLRFPLDKIPPKEYPIYLKGDANGYTKIQLETSCVDCLSLGGINHKPDFLAELK